MDLATLSEEYNYFCQNVKERSILNKTSLHKQEDLEKIARRLFTRIKIREPYRGTREQQEYLYDYVSSSIDKYVRATSLVDPATNGGEAVKYPNDIKLEVAISKELIWTYVIENPSLAGHQLGQRRAIRRLFREFNEAILGKQWSLFPPFFRDRARSLNERYKDGATIPAVERVRLVSDTISSMTDKQALLVYQQFSGLSPSSMLDPVVG